MQLQFKSLAEFSPGRQDQIFRWSLGNTIAPTVIFSVLFLGGLAQCLAPLPAMAKIPIFVRGFSTAGFLLIAWVAWAQTRAGIGPGSLVAVLDSRYLWVKYRSPLNRHIGADGDVQVVGIPLSAIAWCQQKSVKTITQGVNRKKTTKTVDSLDLGLAPNSDLKELKERLEEERAKRKAATQSHQHFPLRILDEERLRLDLYNVSGGSAALEKQLPSSIARREPEQEVQEKSMGKIEV